MLTIASASVLLIKLKKLLKRSEIYLKTGNKSKTLYRNMDDSLSLHSRGVSSMDPTITTTTTTTDKINTEIRYWFPEIEALGLLP